MAAATTQSLSRRTRGRWSDSEALHGVGSLRSRYPSEKPRSKQPRCARRESLSRGAHCPHRHSGPAQGAITLIAPGPIDRLCQSNNALFAMEFPALAAAVAHAGARGALGSVPISIAAGPLEHSRCNDVAAVVRGAVRKRSIAIGRCRPSSRPSVALATSFDQDPHYGATRLRSHLQRCSRCFSFPSRRRPCGYTAAKRATGRGPETLGGRAAHLALLGRGRRRANHGRPNDARSILLCFARENAGTKRCFNGPAAGPCTGCWALAGSGPAGGTPARVRANLVALRGIRLHAPKLSRTNGLGVLTGDLCLEFEG